MFIEKPSEELFESWLSVRRCDWLVLSLLPV